MKQINIGPINYNYYPSYMKPNPYKDNKIDIIENQNKFYNKKRNKSKKLDSINKMKQELHLLTNKIHQIEEQIEIVGNNQNRRSRSMKTSQKQFFNNKNSNINNNYKLYTLDKNDYDLNDYNLEDLESNDAGLMYYTRDNFNNDNKNNKIYNKYLSYFKNNFPEKTNSQPKLYGLNLNNQIFNYNNLDSNNAEFTNKPINKTNNN